jgi:hypothetical protein
MDISPNWNDGIGRMTTREVNEFARNAQRNIEDARHSERARCIAIVQSHARGCVTNEVCKRIVDEVNGPSTATHREDE